MGVANGMSNRLRDALLLEKAGVVCVVGAGGKTSLMYRLARELSRDGEKVLSTTTTRILPPTPEQSPGCILGATVEEIIARAAPALGRHRHVTAAAGVSADPAKLAGLSAETIDRLWASRVFDWVIVEADGAAGRPLKAPAEHEPVIPSACSRLVGVVGLRALGRPLTGQWVFRPEAFSRLAGIAAGAEVTGEAVAAALAHEQGVLKGAPGQCRRLAFLNQADEPGGQAAGFRIADLLKRFGGSRIQRVIVGQVLKEPPVSAVFDLQG
jgi:probable selenium-dependent hydroxylase accessory protein YqeC